MRQIIALRLFLLLTTLEGVLALITTFSTPSMERRAVIFGYSLSRILVIILFAAFILAFASATIWAFRKPVQAEQELTHIETIIANHNRLIGLTLGLLYISILFIFFLFLAHNGYANGPYTLLVIVERLFALLLWGAGIPLQFAITLTYLYPKRLWALLTSREHKNILTVFLVLVLAGSHWILLMFRSNLFYEIQDWFWQFLTPKQFQPSNLYLFATGLLALFALFTILQKPEQAFRNLIISVALAYLLQVGFGFANGKGFESIRLKYIRTLLSAESGLACDSKTGVVTSIQSYEVLYGDTFWLGTKPPGLITFYTGIRELIARYAPDYVESQDGCFETLSTIFAVVLPLVASLALIPIWGMEKLLGNNEGGNIAGILYMSAPNVILMTLVPDQFLYPLLFMLAILALVKATTERSFTIGLTAGALIYLAIFVSFSLLPLMGLAVIWIGINYSFVEKHKTISGIIFPLLGMGLGIAVLWLAGRIFLLYDPLARYQAAIEHHRQIQDITPTLGNIFGYAFLNNVEFLVWSGAPLICLAAIGAFKSFIAIRKGTGTRKDAFILASFLTFLALNSLGQTKAEVGRLWIFLLPLAAIAGSNEAKSLFEDSRKSVIFIFVLQFITTILTFFFFDFH